MCVNWCEEINMTILMLIKTKSMEKKKFMSFAKNYLNIKILVNAFFAAIIACLFKNVYLHSRLTTTIFVLSTSFVISLFDSYLIFRRIKRIRLLEISSAEYLLKYIKNSIIMLGLFFAATQLKYIFKDMNDVIFVLILTFSFWIYQYFLPYIIKMINDVDNKELQSIKLDLNSVCKCQKKFSLYCYEGKKIKNANAFVTGTNLNRSIFISNYLIENISKDETIAILCHEYGHIKNNDIERKVIFKSTALVLFYLLTCIMDMLQMGIIDGISLLLIFCLLCLFLYKRMEHKQEFRADKYAVSVMGDNQILIAALKTLYEINDMMKKNRKLFTILSSHPQLQERINALSLTN